MPSEINVNACPPYTLLDSSATTCESGHAATRILEYCVQNHAHISSTHQKSCLKCIGCAAVHLSLPEQTSNPCQYVHPEILLYSYLLRQVSNHFAGPAIMLQCIKLTAPFFLFSPVEYEIFTCYVEPSPIAKCIYAFSLQKLQINNISQYLRIYERTPHGRCVRNSELVVSLFRVFQ